MDVTFTTALVPFKPEIKTTFSCLPGHDMAKRENHMIVRDSSHQAKQGMTFLGYRSNGCEGEYGRAGNMISRKTTGRCINIII